MNADRPLDEQLSAYLDGELSHDEREVIEERLRRDEGARHRLEELREVVRQIRALPRERLSSRGAAQLASLLKQAEASNAVKKVSWRQPAALAASLLLVCTLLYLSMVELQKERERLAFAPYPEPSTQSPAEAGGDEATTSTVEQLAAAPSPPVRHESSDTALELSDEESAPTGDFALRARASQVPPRAATVSMATTTRPAATQPATTRPAASQPAARTTRKEPAGE